MINPVAVLRTRKSQFRNLEAASGRLKNRLGPAAVVGAASERSAETLQSIGDSTSHSSQTHSSSEDLERFNFD